MKLEVSLVIITKNEELNIERCIRSVPFASDVVVVDSYSQDKTKEIALNLGSRVIEEEWKGFGPQKHRAVNYAKYDWVLCLDADEALSEQLVCEIQQCWNSLDPHVGYKFPRKSFYLGRWILHGGWFPDYQLRLFNRKFNQWNSLNIHEQVQANKIIFFKHPILHWVFRDISHQVITNDRYSGLQASSLYATGRKISFLNLLLKMLIKPWSKFIECYFLKLGFLDGMPGFIIAVSAGYSVFLRWAKIWEKQKRN